MSSVIEKYISFTNNLIFLYLRVFINLNFHKKHTRPVTAKIYRSYISELIAVLNGNTRLREIYIEGDCVWGVFNSPKKSDIDSIFSTAAQAASIIDTLNVKLRKKNYFEIKAGIAC